MVKLFSFIFKFTTVWFKVQRLKTFDISKIGSKDHLEKSLPYFLKLMNIFFIQLL